MTFRSFKRIDPNTEIYEGITVLNSNYIYEVSEVKDNIYALHTTKGKVYILWGSDIIDLRNYLNNGD